MIVLAHVFLAGALAWAFLGLGPLNWLLGFIVLYPVIRLLGLFVAPLRVYAMRVEAGVVFVPWFAYKIVGASWDVARIVLNPSKIVSPAVVQVHLKTRDKRLITLIACLVTLTPGTLALDYRGRALFIHVLDTSSVESVQAALTEIEERVMAWVNPLGENYAS